MPVASPVGRFLLCLVLAVSSVLGSGLVSPTAASETPAPQDGSAWMTPTTVQPGERVTVDTTGWGPGTLLQAVVCGDDAVGGSRACDLTGAVTARADTQGEARHMLTVEAPPRPCPCVVRIATFNAPALAMNVPFTLVGHPVGTPPADTEVATSDLRIEAVEVREDGWLRPFLGLGGTRTLLVTVRNRGDVTVPVPELAYGFGRGEVAPDSRFDPGREVTLGGRERIEVEVDLPWFAFGDHTAVVEWADGTGAKDATTAVFPGGLVLLLLAALALVVRFDVRQGNLRDLRTYARASARRFLDEDGAYPLPEVVYVEEIGGYLVKPAALRSSRLTRRLSGRVSVRDLLTLADLGQDVVTTYADGSPLPPSRPRGGAGLAHLLLRERDHARD